MLRVPKNWCSYTRKPSDSKAYTDKMDRLYSRFAVAYDRFIKVAPFWSRWLGHVLPYVQGGRVLEVSFGPGYLLTKYPPICRVYGLDFNERMVRRAKVKVMAVGGKAKLIQGNVEAMPYPDGFFDVVVNTMAFSGYPDGKSAMVEMLRVLKPGGQLLLLDYDYPENRNVGGWLMVRFIELCGDIMKDIGGILDELKVSYERIEIGCFGSVQLFLIRKQSK